MQAPMFYDHINAKESMVSPSTMKVHNTGLYRQFKDIYCKKLCLLSNSLSLKHGRRIMYYMCFICGGILQSLTRTSSG